MKLKVIMKKFCLECNGACYMGSQGIESTCKVNACINSYGSKWLLHLDIKTKHMSHMEVGRFEHPFTHLRGLR